MAESTAPFDQWGIVEVMGHKKYAGHITEQVIGGASLIRVDVPEVALTTERNVPPYSKLIGAGSIYMITPTSEEVARKAAIRLAQTEGSPIPVYIPEDRQLAATASVVEPNGDDFGPEHDEDEDLH